MSREEEINDFLEDNVSEETSDGKIVALVKWWERKRIIYNILVGITGLLGLYLFWRQVILSEPVFVISGVICYGIAANCCYFLGWMIEVLLITFFPRLAANGLEKKGRVILFLIGVIFSVFLTFALSLFSLMIAAFGGF